MGYRINLDLCKIIFITDLLGTVWQFPSKQQCSLRAFCLFYTLIFFPSLPESLGTFLNNHFTFLMADLQKGHSSFFENNMLPSKDK